MGFRIERVTQFSRLEIAATFAAGSVAVLITGLQPVLLGALVRESIMTFSLAGAMAGLEALFIGIGLIFAALLGKTNHIRIIVIAALGILTLANYVCASLPSPQPLFILRAITGAMSGIVIWAATSVIIRTQSPGRITGYFVATYTALQGACVLFIALYLMAIFGWKSCFLLMGTLAFVAIFLAINLPKKVPELPKFIRTQLKFSIPAIFASLIIFLQLIAFMSVWTFLEPIGEIGGETMQAVQVILSVSLMIQVFGASTGGYIAEKVPAVIILATASIIVIVIGLYFLKLTPVIGEFFLAASLLFSFVWMFIMPFHTQLAIDIDPSGHLALNVPILQICGSVVAPLLGGVLALSGDIRTVMVLTLGAGAAALFLIIVMIYFQKLSKLPLK